MSAKETKQQAGPGDHREILALLEKEQKRFFFAHHSVGRNILDGLANIVQETDGRFSVVPLKEAANAGESQILTSNSGKNGDPESKIAGFAGDLRENRMVFVPDVAFMKFCYVDFTPQTDTARVLEKYSQTIKALKKEFPATVFAHCTVPLTVRPAGWKSRLKRLLGLQVWEDASNMQRERFNIALRQAFPDDPLFDLAVVESTRQDGTRLTFSHKGMAVPSLAPEYSSDGGHLGALGKQVAATAFLRFLADAAQTGIQK